MGLSSVNKITRDELAESLINSIDMGLSISGVKRNHVEYTETKTIVPFLGGEIDKYDPIEDELEVFLNTVRLTEGVHYNIDSASNSIVCIGDTGWVYNVVDEPRPNLFEFFMISTRSASKLSITPDMVSEELLQLLASEAMLVQANCVVETTDPITEESFWQVSFIQGRIKQYDPATQHLNVYLNGVRLAEGIDYTVDNVTNVIVKTGDGSWNGGVNPCVFTFEMFSGVMSDSEDTGNLINQVAQLTTDVATNRNDLNVTTNTANENKNAIDTIKEEIESLKSSVSDGKELVAAAITDKGVETAATDSFATMSENIAKIETDVVNVGSATPDKVLLGYTFSSDDGIGLTGTMPSAEGGTYVPSTSDVVIKGQSYLMEDVVLSGDTQLNADNIKAGAVIFTVEGGFTSDATATASDIKSGKTAYVNGEKIEGAAGAVTMENITPGINDITLSGGQFLANDVIIKGEPNLIAENIAPNKTIYGVAGSYSMDTTANASNILYGETAISKGEKITGTIPKFDTKEYIPTTEDIVIEKGRYLAGDQVIKGDLNLQPEFIKEGFAIFGVAGSYGTHLQERQFEILAADAELEFNVPGKISHIMVVTSTGTSLWMPGKYVVQEGGVFEVNEATWVTNDDTHITLRINVNGDTITYTNEYGLLAVAKAYVFYL